MQASPPIKAATRPLRSPPKAAKALREPLLARGDQEAGTLNPRFLPCGHQRCSVETLAARTHSHSAMGKETAILDLSSQQDWSAVGRLLKDSGTKISSKQINRAGRCAGQPPPRQPIQALPLTTAVRSAPAGTG